MSLSESKQSLRVMAREFRNKILPHPDQAEHAAAQFIDCFNLAAETTIALYLPHGSELDTFPLAELLWARGARVLLPVVGETRILKFHVWTKKSELQNNKFGILEPTNGDVVTPDIIVTPLLAFDQAGYRLGQGGGYYDATLSKMRAENNVIAVGYAYAEQAVLLALPRETHDQKLDYVVTPHKIFSFA